MNDSLLSVFKICLLILLYLFFARVLWAVWSEVRSPKRRDGGQRATVGGRQIVQVQPPPIIQTMSTRARTSSPNSGSVSKTKVPKSRRAHVTKLIVIEPRSRKGANFVIGRELTIGRSPGCTISIIDDEFISQLHARAFLQDTETYVEDLGSTNGSFHNGNRLTSAVPLRKGDRLQIGNTVLEAN